MPRPPIQVWRAEEPAASAPAPAKSTGAAPVTRTLSQPTPGRAFRIRRPETPPVPSPVLQPSVSAPEAPPVTKATPAPNTRKSPQQAKPPKPSKVELPVPIIRRPKGPAQTPPTWNAYTPEDLFAVSLQEAGQPLGFWHWKHGPQLRALSRVKKYWVRLVDSEERIYKISKVQIAFLFPPEDQAELTKAVKMVPQVRAMELHPEHQPAMRQPFADKLLDEALADPSRVMTVITLSGTSLTGTVREVSQHAFRLEWTAGRFVWVYRHGVAILELGPFQ